MSTAIRKDFLGKYAPELDAQAKACAKSETNEAFIFDASSECFKAIKTRYDAAKNSPPVVVTKIASKRPPQSPRPTPADAASLIGAMIYGEYVPDEEKTSREAICTSCDKLTADQKCSMCGCGVSGEAKKILNLAAYVETEAYGCKHPKRLEGKGWPLPMFPLKRLKNQTL